MRSSIKPFRFWLKLFSITGCKHLFQTSDFEQMPKISDKPKTDTKVWKDKYYDCVREIDQLERDTKNVKRQMIRSAQKLSYAIAVSGEAEQLLVGRLKEACRESELADVFSCINELSKLFVDEPLVAGSFISEFPALFVAKLSELEFPVQKLASLKQDLDVGVNSPNSQERVATILVAFFAKLQRFDNVEVDLVGSTLWFWRCPTRPI